MLSRTIMSRRLTSYILQRNRISRNNNNNNNNIPNHRSNYSNTCNQGQVINQYYFSTASSSTNKSETKGVYEKISFIGAGKMAQGKHYDYR